MCPVVRPKQKVIRQTVITPNEEPARREAESARLRLRRRNGAAADILTTPLGVSDRPSETTTLGG